MNRGPLGNALRNFRAKYDAGYAERLAIQQEQQAIAELESQRAAVIAHAARTRLWYGYRLSEIDPNQPARAGPVRTLPPLDVTLTAQEVEMHFPSKLFKLQEGAGYYCDTKAAINQAYETAAMNENANAKNDKEKTDVSVKVCPAPTNDQKEQPRMPNEDDIPENACMVCLEEMKDQDLTKLLTCGHLYHGPCITEWLVCHKAACPLCRYDFKALHKADEEPGSATSPSETVATQPTPATTTTP